MQPSTPPASKSRMSKGDRNRAHYRASVGSQDHILLRLDKGAAASLDAARHATGLSRSAYAMLHILPLLEAMAPRLAAMGKAQASRSQSAATLLGLALDAALAEPLVEEPRACQAAEDFDRLFS